MLGQQTGQDIPIFRRTVVFHRLLKEACHTRFSRSRIPMVAKCTIRVLVNCAFHSWVCWLVPGLRNPGDNRGVDTRPCLSPESTGLFP
jgi:hypothetical protein